jgi:hypothetical protein
MPQIARSPKAVAYPEPFCRGRPGCDLGGYCYAFVIWRVLCPAVAEMPPPRGLNARSVRANPEVAAKRFEHFPGKVAPTIPIASEIVAVLMAKRQPPKATIVRDEVLRQYSAASGSNDHGPGAPWRPRLSRTRKKPRISMSRPKPR